MSLDIDYYELLECERTADDATLKSSYRKLAMKYHPDKNPGCHDIPALLSNGEHVIDAATVSDLGNGDNDTGQKRLEQIKHKIRSSAGRKNPRKASPKQKGLGSLLNSARA